MRALKFAAFFALCLAADTVRAEKISVLGDPPEWGELERFQETMTREEFVRLLNDVYAPGGAADAVIVVGENAAYFAQTEDWREMFTLRFADGGAVFPAARGRSPDAPLAGIKIAIDPGHLGGRWAKMEERWFQIGSTQPITEGDLTLRVAKLLAPKLRALGADVSLVRASSVPLTGKRPAALREAAIAELKRIGLAFTREGYAGAGDPLKENSIRWHSEKLFYRVSEIRARARFLKKLDPDLTLCLHFNAEGWGDPLNPTLVEKNHLHLLVNGAYSAAELSFDDIRFEMLRKLLSRTFAVEQPVSEKLAETLAAATRLEPYRYTSPIARQTGASEFVWARNLLANRIYPSPVLYLEPYVMNNREVFDRIQLGDYEGEREINGIMRKSIFREYADVIAEGLAQFYRP